MAWQIERVSIMALTREGGRQLPELKKLLAKKRGKRQTPKEQHALIHAMSASYRIPIERMKKGPDGRYHPTKC